MYYSMPTLEQIEKADREQICRWQRFLQPGDSDDVEILNKIHNKFKKLGGFTPELSKKIGWDE